MPKQDHVKHLIITSHGDSSLTYRQELGDICLNGETQGKGDVGSLWSIELQTVLRAHTALHDRISLPHVNGD